ncbi:MAG: MATE family efflux transporter [Lentisphaeria bacterium]|nr:MATE family efflux transporter [Lentisphaeria bacterium]
MAKTAIRDFTSGELFKPMLWFSIPFMVSNALQVLYSMTDMLIVGKFVGSSGISAIMTGGFVVMFLMMVGMGMATGGQVLISQLVGKGERHKLDQAIGTLLTMCAVIAVVVSILSLFLTRFILELMDTPPEAFAMAQHYLTICGGGLLFIYIYNAVAAVLRGVGDSVRPFKFIVISALLNIVLDLLFVAVFKWQVAGAAAATVISQAVAMTLALHYIYKCRSEFGFEFKPVNFICRKEMLGALIKLGVPFAVRFGAINISMIFVASLINSLGVAASAAFGIALRLDELANKISQGVMMAVSTIVGQNMGAGNFRRVRLGVYYAWEICGGFFLVYGVIMYLFNRELFSFFTGDAQVLELAPVIVTALLLHYPALLIMKGTNGFVQGIGNAVFGLIIALLDGFVCRIFFSWLFGIKLNMGLSGMVLGYALATYSTALPNLFYFLFVPWHKRKTVI